MAERIEQWIASPGESREGEFRRGTLGEGPHLRSDDGSRWIPEEAPLDRVKRLDPVEGQRIQVRREGDQYMVTLI